MSSKVALRRRAKLRPTSREATFSGPRQSRRQPMSASLVRLRRWAIGLGATIFALIALWIGGVPQQLAWDTGEAVGRAGFSVRHVEITGVNRMARLPVYAAALDQPSNAMPLVDLGAVRARLLKHSWVADARVSRQYPDRLAIHIVERVPAGLWQQNGIIHLIDGSGVPLQRVDANAWPDLPLVVGPNANRSVAGLLALLDAAPALKASMSDAVWIGGRRWDIRFRSGETLALPEGEEAARRALVLFARLDGAQGLLNRGFVRFDMRIPDQMTVRVSKQPGAAAEPADKAVTI